MLTLFRFTSKSQLWISVCYLQLCKILFTNFMCDMRKLCKTSFIYRNFTLINSIKLSFGFRTSKFTLTTSWYFVVVYTKIGKWWMKNKDILYINHPCSFFSFLLRAQDCKKTLKGKWRWIYCKIYECTYIRFGWGFWSYF